MPYEPATVHPVGQFMLFQRFWNPCLIKGIELAGYRFDQSGLFFFKTLHVFQNSKIVTTEKPKIIVKIIDAHNNKI